MRILVSMFSVRGELWSAIVAGVLLLAGFVCWALQPEQGVLHTASDVLYWTSLAIGLVHGLRAAWHSLAKLHFDIDVLMAVGALLAAYLGHPSEGALLLFLFVLAGALEELATERTTRAVEALHKLMPTRALRLSPAGAWETVAPEALAAGERVKVLPGESIPADARVVLGRSSIDQASLTGESVPRSVGPGDECFAGTINVGDPIELVVSRPAAESSIQRVLELVLKAQQQREPVQRLIDKVSQPYALGVLFVSLAVLGIWLWVFHVEWDKALYTAITLLIVASPCAVIIATPTATLAAITRGARAGVLFKGGQAIERLARLRAVCFDKTGTLTIGRMRVHQLHPIGWSNERELLGVAAALEQDSTHPIAAAVREAAKEAKINPPATVHPKFTAGRGVGAEIGGKPALLGTLVHVEELVPVCLRASVAQVLQSVQQRGRIGTVVAHDDQAGVIILSDTTRPGAETLVADLHALGVRPVLMLTGDNRATAKAVAESLGIDRYQAELLPQGKVDAVEALKQEIHAAGAKGGVGVIGDGVNDAPALAAADVSIAVGSLGGAGTGGSEAALESADIVLLSDDLAIVPWAVRLARRARRTIRLNLAFALAAICIMAVATLVGSRMGVQVPLWVGVLGHEGGTMLVVANSLLLLMFAQPRISAAIPSLALEAEPVPARAEGAAKSAA